MRILLWLTLGFTGGCALAVYLPYLWLYGLCGGALLLFFACFRRQKRGHTALLMLLGFLAGLGWYHIYEGRTLSPPKAMDGFTGTVSIRSTDYSCPSDYGSAVEGTLYVQGQSCRVLVYLQGETVTPGDRIYGTFRMRYTAFGGQKDPTFHKGDGIFLLAYPAGDYAVTALESRDLRHLPAFLRKNLEDTIGAVFPEDTAPFANALLLGNSDGLSYDTLSDFSVTGIRHVIAVSGLHVAMLFSFLAALTGNRRGLMTLIGVPVLLLFSAMVGFTPSVVRACVMQFLVLLAAVLNREYDTLTALAAAVLGILVVNPLTVTSVSFQLSVTSMCGMILFAGRINRRLSSFLGGGKGKSLRARLKRGIISSVGVSISAMVFTTPLAAVYFHTVSLIGFLSNLLTLWIISFIFCGIILACLAALLYAPLGSLIAWAVSWGIRYVLTASAWLAKIPYAAVYTESIYIVLWLVLCYVLFAVFWLLGRKYPLRYCAAMVLGLVLAAGAGRLALAMEDYRITMLDVGQGQCILLQAGGKAYMVDCGGDYGDQTADRAAQMLLSQGIFRLDGMILTHFDDDHSGGAAAFLSRIPTDRLIVPNMPNRDGIWAEKTEAAVEDLHISLGDAKITVFASRNLTSDNESSLCVLFQAENCDILITGDRSILGEMQLMQHADLPKLEILVAGHHGAATSTGMPLLSALQPELVLISAGEENRFGHPSAQTLERIEAIGAKVLRTDEEGTIIIRG